MRKGQDVSLVRISIRQIRIPKDYPRLSSKKDYDLRHSIVKHGLVNLIVVDSKNNLIAGKRRLDEMKSARYKSVYVIRHNDVKDPKKRYLLSVIETLHQKEINPIDKARAFKTLMKHYDCSQRTLALLINISKTTIGYYISLLDLPEDVVKKIESGETKAYSNDLEYVAKKKIKTMEQFKKETTTRKYSSIMARIRLLRLSLLASDFEFGDFKKIKKEVERLLKILDKKLMVKL